MGKVAEASAVSKVTGTDEAMHITVHTCHACHPAILFAPLTHFISLRTYLSK